MKPSVSNILLMITTAALVNACGKHSGAGLADLAQNTETPAVEAPVRPSAPNSAPAGSTVATVAPANNPAAKEISVASSVLNTQAALVLVEKAKEEVVSAQELAPVSESESNSQLAVTESGTLLLTALTPEGDSVTIALELTAPEAEVAPLMSANEEVIVMIENPKDGEALSSWVEEKVTEIQKELEAPVAAQATPVAVTEIASAPVIVILPEQELLQRIGDLFGENLPYAQGMLKHTLGQAKLKLQHRIGQLEKKLLTFKNRNHPAQARQIAEITRELDILKGLLREVERWLK
jgi:hypothetical protein